jgi:hypothetical protein
VLRQTKLWRPASGLRCWPTVQSHEGENEDRGKDDPCCDQPDEDRPDTRIAPNANGNARREGQRNEIAHEFGNMPTNQVCVERIGKTRCDQNADILRVLRGPNSCGPRNEPTCGTHAGKEGHPNRTDGTAAGRKVRPNFPLRLIPTQRANREVRRARVKATAAMLANKLARPAPFRVRIMCRGLRTRETNPVVVRAVTAWASFLTPIDVHSRRPNSLSATSAITAFVGTAREAYAAVVGA